MAILLHALSLGDTLEDFTCSAGRSLIVIGTLWLGEPNRFNALVRRDLMGITIVVAAAHALLVALLGS
jgi:hypothetical protein